MSNVSADMKLARQRLSALQLAEALGNVSEACRRRGISRTQFYEYKRRFQTHGLEGLKGFPPVHKFHQQATPPEVVEKSLAFTVKSHVGMQVDTYGSYAFGYLHTGKLPEHAAAVLHNDVLPQYRAWDIEVSAILTGNGREYCGREHHPYELYLALNDIEHRTTRVGSPRTNGFVERFNRTVLDEFFRPTFRKKFYESVEELQRDLDVWLHHYNNERPHRGYRNRGKRPIDTIQEYIKSVRKED